MNYNVNTDNWLDVFDYVVDASLGYHTITDDELHVIRYRMHVDANGGDLEQLWGNHEFWDAMESLEERVAA